MTFNKFIILLCRGAMFPSPSTTVLSGPHRVGYRVDTRWRSFDSGVPRVTPVTGARFMTRRAIKRRIGWGAAFIAAYALVFNVILSSILIASVSPLAAADAHELCISTLDAGSIPGDPGKGGGKAVFRCPLCVGHHLAADAPHHPTELAERIPLRAEAVYSFQERTFARARFFDHLSRGPPALT